MPGQWAGRHAVAVVVELIPAAEQEEFLHNSHHKLDSKYFHLPPPCLISSLEEEEYGQAHFP